MNSMFSHIGNSFGRKSIRKKLTLVMVGISTMTLLLISSLFLTDSYYHSRETLKLKLEVVGSILARETTVAVLYNDETAASDTLSSVEDIASIRRACIYNITGDLFTSYKPENSKEEDCSPLVNEYMNTTSGATFSNTKRHIQYSVPISHNTESVGFLYIFASTQEVWDLTFYRFSYLVMGIAFSVLLSYVIATRLQGVISRPILALSNVATEYAEQKNSSIRAEKFNEDEIGDLVNSFNKMLNTIEEQKKSLLLGNKELEQANAELEEFAYRTSHDLRSPIISTLELLSVSEKYLDEGKTRDVKQCLDFSINLMKKLETLISDILQLTTAKKKEEDDVEVDARQIIADTLDKMSYMENYNAIKVLENYGQDTYVYTKETRFRMIVENLISNAIKYHDPSREQCYITISAFKEEGVFVFRVEDNGLGIPEEKRDKVFSMFSRFHPKVSYGSGLGLYLIKKSADVIRADIKYTALEEGSCFELHIPCQGDEG